MEKWGKKEADNVGEKIEKRGTMEKIFVKKKTDVSLDRHSCPEREEGRCYKNVRPSRGNVSRIDGGHVPIFVILGLFQKRFRTDSPETPGK